MRILMMGGTRFIGVSLTQQLVAQGHAVVLFNRGNHPVPVAGVEQIQGDRKDIATLTAKLQGQEFDAVFDNNGRERSDTEPLAALFTGKVQHFVYVSSAGVYLKTDQPPHIEGDAVDPNSRHKGKHETEAYLAASGLPWTSVRPVYIYGPQNYNDVEAWFFDRIVRDRPIPIPGDGMAITQLGHVEDLAAAMVAILGNDQAKGQIYNISGDRFITFNGLARACAIAAGKDPDQLKLVHFDPKAFDFGKKKAFPLRVQHFFTDTHKAKKDLQWQPKFDLISGLTDSFQQGYLPSGRGSAAADFSLDDLILARS
ncbi:NAD-dependent epimerase/dehydratase family protein [Spirulina major CS-329]|uniref:NAD-dependent epimerase/dehydratase family protein n=1 Tax=Spirulina TaxID=1154 RepID=UPI00232B8885|nr:MULTISPECIES: NAD-dependent epimerase/dehydratase family protein [Spirulina]MDB9494886.1 NAD-dependent epimerase/dehydratase family protein [Spirulina subsalsa CS-330]MDB9504113.1 NAD-dependent epimerase/dehydratase family protein [Spirulina major CS-329]